MIITHGVNNTYLLLALVPLCVSALVAAVVDHPVVTAVVGFLAGLACAGFLLLGMGVAA